MQATSQTATATAAPTLRPFDRVDWACFAGVETANPLIEFFEEFAVIQDGNTLSLIDGENEYRMTLPSPAVATLTGNALLAELEAAGDDELRIANYVQALGFTETIEIA